MRELKKVPIVEVKLTQKGDTVNPDYQNVIFNIDDGDGGGAYVSIKTERWSIDVEDMDQFCQYMKDLVKQYDDAKLFK